MLKNNPTTRTRSVAINWFIFCRWLAMFSGVREPGKFIRLVGV